MLRPSPLALLCTILVVIRCDLSAAEDDDGAQATIDPTAAFHALPRQEGADPRPVEAESVPPHERIVCDDDLDAMAAEVEPPARFADHAPDWRVETRTFTYRHYGHTRERDFQVVLDGERVVALLRSGDIQLLARTPATAATRLRMPTERFHLDTMLGPSLPTWGFVKKVDTHGSIYNELGDKALLKRNWEVSERHLALVHRQELPGQTNHIRFVFTVDPVYGYRIDAVYDITWDEAPGKGKIPAGTFCPGCYVPWSYQAWFDRTVYTPASGGMVGWANNLVCMDRSDQLDRANFNWRDGGFIAYLPDREGWSPCFTRKDGGGTTTQLRVCNAHNDFHITIPLPKLERADDGRHHLRYVHRLLHLPPELTARVWDGMRLISTGQKALLISLGAVQDFESQPVPLAEAHRGLMWTARHPEIVTGDARSGDRSIRITGRAWPNLPQVSLLPGVRYRLEGWFKLEPWPADRVDAARRQLAVEQEARRRKLRGKLTEKGKKKGIDYPMPPATDWATVAPGAYIAGDFYRWSPYANPMVRFMRTSRATAGKAGEDGWQHVILDFAAPEWGPFINLSFTAELCDALLDDFALRIIGLPEDAQDTATADVTP